jgi:hypothetical protein
MLEPLAEFAHWITALSVEHVDRMETGPVEAAILQWLAAAGAIVAAFSVGYVAHYDFGISIHEIRVAAAIGASTIGALLAIEYFGRKLRRPK